MAKFSAVDVEYLKLVKRVLDAPAKPCRQGTKVHSVTAAQLRVPVGRVSFPSSDDKLGVVAEGFPLLAAKRVPHRMVWAELAWFLAGSTDARDLQKLKVPIWNADAARFARERALPEPGPLGPIYGHQWRRCAGRVDQIEAAVKGLAEDPFSRRHLVNAWNVDRLRDMALPPCHYAVQWVAQPGPDAAWLDTVVSMRSTDIGLGLPFNIASYAMLTLLVAAEVNRRKKCVAVRPRELIVNMADAHIYSEHAQILRGLVGTDDMSGCPVVAIPPSLASPDRFANAPNAVLGELVRPDSYHPGAVIKLPLIA